MSNRSLIPQFTYQCLLLLSRCPAARGLHLILLFTLFGACSWSGSWSQSLVMKRVTVIDATGRSPEPNMTVIVEGDRIVTIPWTLRSPYRRREIFQGEGEASSTIRPMRVRDRAVFVEALGDAHRWLDELTRHPDDTTATIAIREDKTERSIRMTLSLAFVAPPLVAAAIEGRLPRGFGVKRLMDLPMVWPQQWTALGLAPPA